MHKINERIERGEKLEYDGEIYTVTESVSTISTEMRYGSSPMVPGTLRRLELKIRAERFDEDELELPDD